MADVASALADAQSKMDKAVEVAKDDFATIRTGRAHPALFNKIMVDYYGTYTPLSQLASIQVPEARMAIVSPFDKGAMASIEKAIRESDLGVNPGNDGVVIRVALPQLSEERRKDYIKVAKGKAEDSKVSIRNIRRAAKELMEKETLNAEEIAKIFKNVKKLPKRPQWLSKRTRPKPKQGPIAIPAKGSTQAKRDAAAKETKKPATRRKSS